MHIYYDFIVKLHCAVIQQARHKNYLGDALVTRQPHAAQDDRPIQAQTLQLLVGAFHPTLHVGFNNIQIDFALQRNPHQTALSYMFFPLRSAQNQAQAIGLYINDYLRPRWIDTGPACSDIRGD
jgi:hypothetical protein